MKHITKILLGFVCGVFVCVAPGIANAQDDCQNCKDLFNDIGTDPNLCDLMSSPKDKCANVTDNTLLSICMDSVEDWCSAYRKEDGAINADDFCQDTTYCTGGGGGTGGGGEGGGSNTCPSNCVTPQVNYRELNDDTLEVTSRYCNASTNYVCRTKTENITLSTEKWFDSAGDGGCSNGTCVDWDCVWTEGVGTTCPSLGAGGTKPFCTCTVYTGNSLKTVAVRLGCNSTDSSGYNCNQGGTDDEDSNKLYCDLTASTSAGAGVCRYKKTCSTDCTNAWNVTGHVQRKEYLYRLKGSCDYTTGSCVSASGTVVSDFDYKCNHDNRAYETAPKATCTRMRSGKPGTCNGCSVCDTTANAWENVSGNPAYQQQYHYNFSPISGTDRYQCVKTMDSQYRCNAGYYGNSGSSMTGCNACPTLEQSNLTIVSQNDACDGYHFVYTAKFGATSINDCYASTGNDGSDTTYCVAKMSDGTGTFYWSYNDAETSTSICNWQ